MHVLNALQNLLADIYDVPLPHEIADFLLTDRTQLPQAARDSGTDEQVLLAADGETLWIHVYLDAALLRRLESADPFEALHGGNLADTLTALEGVSHFLYLAWNASHDRTVTLMELELQAEIDKYVSSLWLLRAQDPRRFPRELHHVLFGCTHIDPGLAGERVGLYRCADRYAARYCRRLARTLQPVSTSAHADVTAELRRFYRLTRERKIHHIERVAA